MWRSSAGTPGSTASTSITVSAPSARASFGGAGGSRDVLAVHVQHPRAAPHVVGHVAGPERQRRVAIPEHRAVSGGAVDQHDCRTRARLYRLGRCRVDAFLLQARQSESAQLVVAEPAHVSRPPAQARATHHGRGHLPAGQSRELLDAVLGVAAGELGDDGQLIDAVLAEPDDVEGTAGRGRQREGDLHAGQDASTGGRPRAGPAR